MQDIMQDIILHRYAIYLILHAGSLIELQGYLRFYLCRRLFAERMPQRFRNCFPTQQINKSYSGHIIAQSSRGTTLINIFAISSDAWPKTVDLTHLVHHGKILGGFKMPVWRFPISKCTQCRSLPQCLLFSHRLAGYYSVTVNKALFTWSYSTVGRIGNVR